MATTKNKSKLSLPPVKLDNPKMQAMIEKGLSGPEINSPSMDQEDKLKSFTFKIYESELQQIRTIQNRLPKRDRISIADFVIEAVKEKIAKENQKYN